MIHFVRNVFCIESNAAKFVPGMKFADIYRFRVTDAGIRFIIAEIRPQKKIRQAPARI